MKTDSITNLLKFNNADISAVKANKALVNVGLLEEKERPSAKYPGKVMKYKALTEPGLKYGINVENPNSILHARWLQRQNLGTTGCGQ